MRWIFRRFRSDADLEEELKAHLEMQAEDEPPGLAWEERRRRAAVKLGNRRTILERVRDGEWATLLETVLRDAWLGVRLLRKSPVFTLTAVITLALGIGANTAIFTLLYGLLLRSLPVNDPGTLATINLTGKELRVERVPVPWRLFEALQTRSQAFNDISAWALDGVVLQERGSAPRMENALLVSGNAFAQLGIRPIAGRLLTEVDDQPGGSAAGWPVVLSYGLWQERFGGDARVLGKRIQISGLDAVIRGVTPANFHGVFPGWNARLYLPIRAEAALHKMAGLESEDSLFFCWALARRKPGVSLRQANAELALYSSTYIRGFLAPHYRYQTAYREVALRAVPARAGIQFYLGDVYGKPLWIMQGLVGVVLLLCCINVGGLLLARAETRQREFAVRAALGAARWRILLQCLVESLLVAGAGAALGASLARGCGDYLLGYFVDPNMSEGMYVAPNQTVLLFTAGLAVLATLSFGVLPAWYASRVDAGTLLKARTTTGERRQRAGRMFVPVEIALALMLLESSALLSQSLARMQGEPLGFDAAHVTIETPPFNELPQKGDALLDLYQRVVDRLQQAPGIEAAAVTLYTPMTNYQPSAEFHPLGGDRDGSARVAMTYNEVGPGYFQAMRVNLLSGREFRKNERDREVCIVNESAAAYLFPRAAAIGQYLENHQEAAFAGGIECRVVGVVADTKYASVRAPAPRTVYLPLTKEAAGGNFELVFLMRSQNKQQAVEAYRKVAAETVPTMPLVRFATLQAQLDDSLGSQRLITLLSNLFSGLALLLSAIGLYGLLAANVMRRRGEIGLRMALGAKRGAVLQMILQDAFRLLLAGAVLGGAAMVVTTRWLEGMLFGVSAADPVTMILTMAVLAAVTLLAGLIPAVRAASVDPMVALRSE